jgi:hypothetical protein
MKNSRCESRVLHNGMVVSEERFLSLVCYQIRLLLTMSSGRYEIPLESRTVSTLPGLKLRLIFRCCVPHYFPCVMRLFRAVSLQGSLEVSWVENYKLKPSARHRGIRNCSPYGNRSVSGVFPERSSQSRNSIRYDEEEHGCLARCSWPSSGPRAVPLPGRPGLARSHASPDVPSIRCHYGDFSLTLVFH